MSSERGREKLEKCLKSRKGFKKTKSAERAGLRSVRYGLRKDKL